VYVLFVCVCVCVYVFGGRVIDADSTDVVYSGHYGYDVQAESWTMLRCVCVCVCLCVCVCV